MFRLGGSAFHIAILIVHYSQNKMCYSNHIYYTIPILLHIFFRIKTIQDAIFKHKKLHSNEWSLLSLILQIALYTICSYTSIEYMIISLLFSLLE